MNEETILKDHWAIDFQLTNQAHLNDEYIAFAKDVVDNDITLLKNTVGDNNRIDDSHIINIDSNLFLIPKYSQTFAIQKRTKYTAKTKKWIGHVIGIENDSFIARLEELNDPTTYEIGEFDKFDVLPDDLPLLAIGATFYWSIGYLTSNSQRKRESTIKFRRIGNITTDDFDKIKDSADNLFNSINWE